MRDLHRRPRSLGQVLPGADVLPDQAEGTPLVRGLRLQARARSGGGDAGEVGEEGLLPRRLEGRDGARLLPRGPGQADADPLQPREPSAREGLDEEAGGHVLAVAGVGVPEAAVDGAVEDSGRPVHDALGDLAVQLHPDIAVGRDVRGVAALDEGDHLGRLQPLEVDGRLELPRADAQPGHVVRIEVGVVEGQRAAREVGHEAEVEVARHRALGGDARPPHHEGVGGGEGVGVVGEVEAPVELDVARDLHEVGRLLLLLVVLVFPRAPRPRRAEHDSKKHY